MQYAFNPHLEYFSRLFEGENSLKTLSDFANCLLVAQILSKIREFEIIKLQQNPTTFAHIFTNLKETYKKIEEFWNKQLDKELQCQQIDLVEIAHHQTPKQINKLLNLVVQTLVLSSEKEYFVGKILQASTATQQYFMNIVQNTLQARKTFSPRKQREQRLYDKMVELDHENENLQNVIVELCREKQELQIANKKYQEKIAQKDNEITNLNQNIALYTQTPMKKRSDGMFDTNQKNAEFAEKLKQKMLEITKQYESETLSLQQQVNYLSQRAQMVTHLENQLEMHRVKLQANQESMKQFADLTRKFTEMKIKLIEKEDIVNEYTRKLNIKASKIQELQEKLVEKQMEIERKNIQIEELTNNNALKSTQSFDDPLANISSLSLQKSLSEHCPEVANTQAQFLYENNKKLREQLQRATTTIKQRECEIQKLKKQCEKRQSFETQNKKLLAIIEQMTEQHDQQKAVILGCIHELRMKTMKQWGVREKARKQETKATLKLNNSIGMLSRKKLPA